MRLWWQECFEDPGADAFGGPSRELEVLRERLAPHRRILDVGCGEGRNALCLARDEHLVFALDISIAAVRKALRRASLADLGIRAWVQDVTRLGLRTRFDVVLCQGVLHLLLPDERDRLLRSLRGLTLPGGFNVVSAFTSRVPPPPDMAPAFLGLADEGDLRRAYGSWDEIMWRGYVYDDERGGGRRRTHSIEKIIARRPVRTGEPA